MSQFDSDARDAFDLMMRAVSFHAGSPVGNTYIHAAMSFAENARTRARTRDEKRVAKSLVKLARKLADSPEN